MHAAGHTARAAIAVHLEAESWISFDLPPPGSNATAAQYNSDGIAHYEMGHWSIAKDRFSSAIEADPNLAEAHFNLGLALNKLNLQAEATTHFKKAAELAPDNSAIVQSGAIEATQLLLHHPATAQPAMAGLEDISP